MSILERVQQSLQDFHPKNHRQFVAFHIARRFNDLPNLARYLNTCELHLKKVLLEAARLAERRSAEDGRPAPEQFFEMLQEWRRREES